MIRLKGGDTVVKERPKVKATERALPRAEPAGKKPPPRRPVEVVASGDGPRFLPFTFSLPEELVRRVEDWGHGRRLTRSAAVRALLEKGLGK